MRIILLISSMECGGAERVASTLCNAWAARGDRVTLVATFSGGGHGSYYPLSNGIEFLYLADTVKAGGRNIRTSVQRIAALRKLIVDRSPDVIVSFLPNVNVFAILSSARLTVPVIICERSDPASRRYPWALSLLCKISYRYADMVTVQTATVAEKIRNVFSGLREVRIIPNPVPEALKEVQAHPRGPRRVLLSMGRLSAEKQIDKLIGAFGQLAPRYPEWDLCIYGSGRLMAALAEQVDKAGLARRVFLKGTTSAPWKVMAEADAFALVSAYEGFPNALVEAMGVGLPCVTFDCPCGPREITSDGRDAVLVALNDQHALVAALDRIMRDDELRRQLGQRARESVLARFNVDEIVRRWDGFFREVGAI